jgi:hypothetical protein
VGVHDSITEDHANDMSTLTVDVLGTAVRVAAPAPVLAQLRAVLVDLEPATSVDRELALAPRGRGFDVHDSGRLIRHGVDPAVAAATVVWRLNAIAAESTLHVLIHAACVAGPLGGGVLLVGGTGAGKSTLAAACVTAGFSYLSDELAAVDRRTGLVTPYAKPLGLGNERLVPASALGIVSGSPATPTALLFPRYGPGLELGMARLDPSWTLVALAAHATNLQVLGGRGLAWLAGLAVACPAFQLTHADAETAVTAIERAVGGPGRPPTPAPLLDPITDDTMTVAVGESLAVLHEPSGRIHLLNPSAAAVWRRAAGMIDRRNTSSLLDAVMDGSVADRPDRPVVAVTVDRLVRTGLLAAPPGR